MNRMKRKILVLLLGMFCFASAKAQNTLYYEFECDYLDYTFTCPTYRHGDSILIVFDLFSENDIPDYVVFRFQDSCVFLTIDGQEGLFWGDSQIGSWDTKGDESERFTIEWDTLHCLNNYETIYKFEFIPYYNKTNPYMADDGTFITHEYYDMISYYWTYSAGVIAIEGDWLFVRKDQENLKKCLMIGKRYSHQ